MRRKIGIHVGINTNPRYSLWLSSGGGAKVGSDNDKAGSGVHIQTCNLYGNFGIV